MNAIVTGASRGIGKYLADRLETDGWDVERWSRSTGVDVTVRASIPIATIPVHALVHCSAILGEREEIASNLPPLSEVVRVNIIGTMQVMARVAPVMQRQRSGSVVLFSGGGACCGLPRFAAYAASKAAVVRLAETYAMELAAFNVRVNAVAPGWQDTDMGRQFKDMGGEVRTEGTLPEVWELVRWLLSDESAHVTGRLVHIRDDYRNWPNPLPEDWAKLRRVEPWTSA